MLAHTMAIAAAHQLSATVVAGFVDDAVEQLLDLYPQRELALALVPIGRVPATTTSPATHLTPLNLALKPIADREIDVPAIRTMHDASTLPDEATVAAWRGTSPQYQPLLVTGPRTPLQPLGVDELPRDRVAR